MHILLLGAGFTHNWGGWLASELMGDLLGRVARNGEVHRLLRSSQGFESALEEVQQRYLNDQSAGNREALYTLQAAVMGSFQAMNEALAARGALEFPGALHQLGVNPLHKFLYRFDAIFTLNQDLIFELLYQDHTPDQHRFNGFYFPGVRPSQRARQGTPAERLQRASEWQLGDLALERNLQPIFKLHGSMNWRDPAGGGELVVMGGAKQRAIARSDVLRWYWDQFQAHLQAGDTKALVIGYGFRDSHINQALVEATGRGLKVFTVSPQGSDAFMQPSTAAIRAPYERLDELFLIGESRRPLSTSFSRDFLEHGKLMRFFD